MAENRVEDGSMDWEKLPTDVAGYLSQKKPQSNIQLHSKRLGLMLMIAK